MEVKVTCCRTFFHTSGGRLYSIGMIYTVEPEPELAEFFLWDPELRETLRAEQARKYGKSKPGKEKAAELDARKLVDVAHSLPLVSAEPKTLFGMAPKPSMSPTDKPVALSQIDTTFLG